MKVEKIQNLVELCVSLDYASLIDRGRERVSGDEIASEK